MIWKKAVVGNWSSKASKGVDGRLGFLTEAGGVYYPPIDQTRPLPIGGSKPAGVTVCVFDWNKDQEPEDLNVAELVAAHRPNLLRLDQPWNSKRRALVRSMEEDGMIWPIIVCAEGCRVIGKNRLVAAMHLGWETIKGYRTPIAESVIRSIG